MMVHSKYLQKRDPNRQKHYDIYKAQILTRIFDDPHNEGHLPRPFGVFYKTERTCYEDAMAAQLEEAKSRKPADLDKLLKGNEVWTIS